MAGCMNQDELKVLEERIKANPKSRSFLQLAEAYIEAGRRAEALELLKNGEEYYPYYLAARIAYGKLLREEKETDRAIEQFEFVNRTIPDNLLALKNLAELYLDKDRFSEAKAMADAAMALSPNDPEMLKVLDKLQGREMAAPLQSVPTVPEKGSPEPLEETQREETIVEMPHELFAEAAENQKEGLETGVPSPILAGTEEVSSGTSGALESEAPSPEPPAAVVAGTSTSGLPKTETMGDLLFDQGHMEEALEVYEGAFARDTQSSSLPEKINTVKTMLRMTGSPVEASEPPPEIPEPAPEPVAEAEPMPAPPISEPLFIPEPQEEALPVSSPEQAEEEEVPVGVAPEATAPSPEPLLSSGLTASPVVEGLTDQIIDKVRDRMGREMIGFVRMTLDGLSAEASDSGHWADILAAEGVEIVRAVTEMTRLLNWGELQGTVVWMDHAVLYGLPVNKNEALFLALKPGANVGLCRLLVSQAIGASRGNT